MASPATGSGTSLDLQRVVDVVRLAGADVEHAEILLADCSSSACSASCRASRSCSSPCADS
ncbi:MAG: hypothetical protein U0802_00855 [Candidatus Binatia bacterium]